MDSGELMNRIVSHAEGFVTLVSKLFSDKGILLDYSIESLEIVDVILEELRAAEWKGVALESLAYVAGAYICETVRKNYGGEYQYIEEEDQVLVIAGLPDFYVSIRPFQKVMKRIINGKEDSISFYIKGYKEHIERGKKEKNYSITLV
ncbi:MAG: hypothetical protein K2O32_04225 [Acetatifactor sp.]|nr:hypothetical protein [Acetatifactor sp.]